jgi:hypothetical protein
LYTNHDWEFIINNLQELKEFGNENTKEQKEIDYLVNNQRDKEVKNINDIKYALLLSSYGIGFRKAISLEICSYNFPGNLFINIDFSKYNM